MKIQQIEIEKYGFWNNLHYRFQDEPITVVFGQNGSGKSTLSQLIKKLVYHSANQNSASKVCDPNSSVRFHLFHDNQQFVVEQNATKNPVQVFLAGEESSNIVPLQHFYDAIYQTEQFPNLLDYLLAIADNEDVESLLNNEAISRRFFQSAQNPEVQRILKIHHELHNEKTKWFDASQKSGMLVELLSEHEGILHQIEETANQLEAHREAIERSEQLKDKREDHENRQSGMQRQLRGHEYLQLVYNPWNQVRSIEKDLSQIPVIKDFPHNGLQKLNAIEADLEEQINLENNCTQIISESKSQRASLKNELLSNKQLRMLKKYLAQKEWFEDYDERLIHLEQKKTNLEEITKQLLSEIEDDWPIDRLLKTQIGPAVHSQFLKAGQKYQNSLARRSRFRKQYKRTLAKYRSIAEEQDACLKTWRIDNFESAAQEMRETLDSFDDYSKLHMRAAEYKLQINSIREQLRRMETSLSLPPWVNGMLIGFGSVGGSLAILGLVFGIQTSSLVGTIYALLGATCLGTSWSLKKHFHNVIRKGVDLLYDELHEKEFRLNETQRSIKKLQSRSANPVDHSLSELSDTEMIRQTVIRLAELELHAIRFEHNSKRRQRLTKMRNRLKTIQKETDECRQNWCRQLEEMGLEPALNVQLAYEIWTTIGEAREIAQEWNLVEKRIVMFKEKKHNREIRFREIDQQISSNADPAIPIEELLQNWHTSVTHQQELRTKYRSAGEEISASEEQLRGARINIEQLQSQRSALMLQAEAVDYDDFLHRSTSINQREELTELLEIANQELEETSQTETEFAISQEDLETYNSLANEECVVALSQEIEDLNNDIANIEEEIVGEEDSILELENDKSSSSLRFSLAQKRDEIRDALCGWISSQISCKAMTDVKNNFEKYSQLPAMQSASRLLNQISKGTLTNLWAPLEGTTLKVENRDDEEWKLSQLSAGFQEQVALAIRLTLIESISENGNQYPILWDDLLRHMDEEHAAVAIEAILSVLPEHQQVIYFTCHRHMVELFQNHNIPIWNLPTTNPQTVSHRKVG